MHSFLQFTRSTGNFMGGNHPGGNFPLGQLSGHPKGVVRRCFSKCTESSKGFERKSFKGVAHNKEPLIF